MNRLWLDYETFSPTDIKAGVYRYTEDPAFLPLMAAWSRDKRTVNLAVGVDEIRRIPGLFDPRVIKVAHNANFERVVTSRVADLPVGTYFSPSEYHDTQAVGAEYGYPRRLERLAPALGAEPKDSAGTRLINIFSKPDRNGRRVLPEEKPNEWRQFCDYCVQDVRTLIDVDTRLGNWPTERERQVYLADQRINDLGMKIDLPLAVAAAQAAEVNAMEHELELMTLTGIRNANSPAELTRWLRESGLRIPNLRAETVERLLQEDLKPDVRRALELRQELALVASKKFTSALASVSSDGRLRGGFGFFGAHTGRWAGRGVQPHNLPRATLHTEDFDYRIHDEGKDAERAVEMAVLDLLLGLGCDAHTLKALVRGLFVGPFTVVDYAAIEARVIAWLAGEQWSLDAFASGRDIYVETAERMGGLSRSQGKVAVLALGYAGGVASLRHMGAQGTDGALRRMVDRWRRANPNVVDLWATLDSAFKYGGRVGDHLTVERDGSDRSILLPSGRSIVYHNVKSRIVETPYGPKTRMSFMDPRKGIQVDTYGGRLTENVTQAVARDILAESLPRLHAEGFNVVGHVHDEIIVEGTSSTKVVKDLMTVAPDWAPDLPLDGKGFTCARYRKD